MNLFLLDIKFWVDIAQIVTAFVTTVGIGLSVIFSRNTLKEIQQDRIYNQRPYLAFEYGGHVISIIFKTLGDGNTYALPYWPHFTGDPRLQVPTFGHLKNLGTGPALSIKISWIVEEIHIKGEKLKIDDDKRKEVQFSKSSNTNPLIISHLLSNQETGIHLIPSFISRDFDRTIKRANGFFIISYEDTLGNEYSTKQKFHVFIDYDKPAMEFHTTFSDIIKNENN